MKKYDEAFKLYQYSVKNFSTDEIYTMWSLTGAIKYYIRNDKDEAAEAAFNQLLTTFSKEPTLTEQIHYVARKYEEFEKYDKAIKLYQYNIETSTDPTFAMRSQVRIVRCHISEANEVDAQASIEKLITLFPDRSELPKELYKTADELAKAGYNEKAYNLYQRVINNWADANDLDTYKYTAISNITRGDEDAVTKTIDNMLIEFKDNPKLAQAVFQIGERYWDMALAERRKIDRDQALNENAKDCFTKAHDIWERIVNDLPMSSTATEAHKFAAG